MVEQRFSLRARIRSFRYAIKGLRTLWHDEHNARVHTMAALLAIALGFSLKVSMLEWVFLIACITAVFASELLNSAIERTCDAVSTLKNPYIGKAKDLSAAATLITSIGAGLIGALIFIPKLIELWLQF